jgi:hypothetical protein
MVPYVKPEVVVRPMRAMLDLIRPGTTTGLTLNPEARAFFERIDGERNLMSIAKSMMEVYDAPLELLIEDALEVMCALTEANIVGWLERDRPSPDTGSCDHGREG